MVSEARIRVLGDEPDQKLHRRIHVLGRMAVF